MPEGWARASEVLSEEEWEQLDELPPSRVRELRRQVNGERTASSSRSGRRLRRAERILRKQASGTFPVSRGEEVATWAGRIRSVAELLEVARRPQREGQSWRDYHETRAEALARAHDLVRSLEELCPTSAELLELREAGP